MIPGDIDLTQNLDFRNVRKRDIPQLPASWKGKNRLNISNDNLNTYISSGGYTITWRYHNNYYEDYFERDSNSTTTMTIRGIREVNNDYQLSWTTTYDDNLDYTIYYWNDLDTNCITSFSSNDISSDKYVKPEYDIFGNRIKHPEPIPKIPWGTYKRDCTPIIHPIAWRRSVMKWIKYDEDYIPDIPWDTEDYGWHHLSENLSTPIKRAKNLISWLSKKSSSFIERYFDKDDEKVDMSYLTNMSWIRVKDAVIDSI